MKFLLGVVLTFLLIAPLCVQGESRDEDPAEAMVRHIAKDLRCAVCQNQSVYESNSELAKDMLRIVRDKVMAGEKEAVIRDYFFQRYGDYIYLEPTTSGMNWILWGGPFLGLGIGGLALWAAMQSWRKRTLEASAKTQETTTVTDDTMKKRIQQEMDQVRM
ncbi:MAG: cytochrome c-type biogenesis protein CcmH [Magnetococcales bacterium]|nr:cytochrome c-type biogenesis protein CcmH [Magnetococcales bacterium]